MKLPNFFMILFVLFAWAPATGGQSPGRLAEIYNPAGVRPDGVYVDELLGNAMKGIKKIKPPLAGVFPKVTIEKVRVYRDEFAEVNELFYRRGWTDGLPIVPPTKKRVNEMLKGSDLPSDFLIGIIEPMDGLATIEKIAVNAVMAGCRPEYMPVVLAAVEAITHSDFNLRGMTTTTSPDIPMVIVSGPILTKLDINYGANTLGRGWKANATIGRALHLIMQNIGGSWPGITDMSTLGQPGEYSMLLGENDEASPWDPLRMDMGLPKASSTVIVIGAEGIHNIFGIGQTSEGYLKMVADYLAGMGRPVRSAVLLIVAQDTARMLAKDGWTKESMMDFIRKHAVVPFSKYKERFIDTGTVNLYGAVPQWLLEVTNPETMVPVPVINQFLILVAGGTGEKSMLIPGWINSRVQSKEIRLSESWEELVDRQKEQ